MILRVPRLTHEQKENETDSPMRAMCVLPILLVIESWTKNLRMFAWSALTVHLSFITSKAHEKHEHWKLLKNQLTFLFYSIKCLYRSPFLFLTYDALNSVQSLLQIAVWYLFNWASKWHNNATRTVQRKIFLVDFYWNNPKTFKLIKVFSYLISSNVSEK